MQLVNETGQAVFYWITSSTSVDCGTIAVNGLADLPGYDNQTNVQVEFLPAKGGTFAVTIPQTQVGNEVEMALIAV